MISRVGPVSFPAVHPLRQSGFGGQNTGLNVQQLGQQTPVKAWFRAFVLGLVMLLGTSLAAQTEDNRKVALTLYLNARPKPDVEEQMRKAIRAKCPDECPKNKFTIQAGGANYTVQARKARETEGLLLASVYPEGY